MPYLPYIIAAVWLAGFILLLWGWLVSPEQTQAERDAERYDTYTPQGPDGTSENGTKS